jgi:riboflavin synthase
MKIGLVDTTFSRINMGDIAVDELTKKFSQIQYVRKTVPGVKDLAVECQILFEKENCDIVMALGMVGDAPIDQVCGHEASTAIQNVMLKFSKHIIEVFVHMNEAVDDKDLFNLCDNRVRKHVHNAIYLINDPTKLIENAGTGKRQGRKDVGAVNND